MLKVVGWMIRTVTFILFILVGSHLLKWEGRTVSEQVRLRMRTTTDWFETHFQSLSDEIKTSFSQTKKTSHEVERVRKKANSLLESERQELQEILKGSAD